MVSYLRNESGDGTPPNNCQVRKKRQLKNALLGKKKLKDALSGVLHDVK